MIDVVETVRKLIAPMQRRVMLMVGRCVISATYADGGIQLTQLKLLADEVRDQVEQLQEYGFASRPQNGAEGVCVFPAGNRDHGVLIATEDRRYRPTDLEKGETALYTDEGDYLKLRRSREFHGRANKWKFQGSSEELMDLLVQTLTLCESVCDKLSTTTTNTILGPMKLNDFAYFASRKADATAIKGKLSAMKAT